MSLPDDPMEQLDTERTEPERKEQDTHHTLTRTKQDKCSFCETNLITTHTVHLKAKKVVENSSCPGCGVTFRPKYFTLH